jgi:hypothetical protein
MEPRPAEPEWGPVKRVLFRFLFAYLVLYIFPFPLDVIPYVGMVTQPYQDLWNAIVPWVGEHVFHVAITVQPNGSGDTTYNYVQVFCYLVLALTAAAVWTLLDRRRRDYFRLNEWLRVYVRFSLATAMISYGAMKVIPAQFPGPSLDRLLQPIGDASPMGLLWTFMGASKSYNVFSGLGEMLGGLLLLTRRTTTLGALVSSAVLVNIVMLNFSYDVPVKLYSCHLLAMAVLLMAPDARRLANLLVLNRGTAPTEIRPLFERRWLHRGALILRTVFVLGFAVLSFYGAYEGRKNYDLAMGTRPPFYGIWNVEGVEVDGRPQPPGTPDAARWRRVVFGYPGNFAVHLMSDSRQRYFLKLDAAKKTLGLTKRDDPEWKTTISYQETKPDLLLLAGPFDGHKIRVKLRRTEIPKFRLKERGFHWINEYPFNY